MPVFAPLLGRVARIIATAGRSYLWKDSRLQGHRQSGKVEADNDHGPEDFRARWRPLGLYTRDAGLQISYMSSFLISSHLNSLSQVPLSFCKDFIRRESFAISMSRVGIEIQPLAYFVGDAISQKWQHPRLWGGPNVFFLFG